jgi:hypothetical protein
MFLGTATGKPATVVYTTPKIGSTTQFPFTGTNSCKIMNYRMPIDLENCESIILRTCPLTTRPMLKEIKNHF